MDKPLRFASPALYQQVVDKLSAHGLNPYDVDGQVVDERGGHILVMSYGGDFTYHADYAFEHGEWEMVETGFLPPAFHEYLDKTVLDVKDRLVKDYRKGMKQKF